MASRTLRAACIALLDRFGRPIGRKPTAEEIGNWNMSNEGLEFRIALPDGRLHLFHISAVPVAD